MDNNVNKYPLVSVLMTAYNREKYIAEAIESVLASTYTNFELIIVDDCSKDKTIEIARSYEVTDRRVKVYINAINLGDYPNRNQAASYAKGQWLTYVDSDDKIYPHTLEIMMHAVNEYPDASLFMNVRNQDESLKGFQYLLPKESYHLHFRAIGFLETGPLGILIKKTSFDELGNFSGKRMIGDTELWLKLAAKYPLVRLQKGLVFWRRHENQEFNVGIKHYLVDALRMYRDALLNINSPLGIEDGKKIFRQIKRQKFSLLLIYLIKSQKFRECFFYFKEMFSIKAI